MNQNRINVTLFFVATTTTSSSYILTNWTKDARGWIGCSRNIHSIVYMAKAARDIRRTTEKENLDPKEYDIRNWKH